MQPYMNTSSLIRYLILNALPLSRYKNDKDKIYIFLVLFVLILLF
jgi:hypothetical protein